MQTDISMKRKVLQFQGFVKSFWVLNTENHCMYHNCCYQNDEQFASYVTFYDISSQNNSVIKRQKHLSY